MKEITFYSTNNAWVNNGLVAMAQIMRNYDKKVEIIWSDDSISFKSLEKPVTDYIAQAMQTLAGKELTIFQQLLNYSIIVMKLDLVINLLKNILPTKGNLKEKALK